MKREVLELKSNVSLCESSSQLLKSNHKWWLCSNDAYLCDVYDNYSIYKECSMDYCRKLCAELNGERLRIISHNCMVFTVGFEFNHPTTGERCFAYITRDYNRFIRLSNI